jgi:hypothetical protein
MHLLGFDDLRRGSRAVGRLGRRIHGLGCVPETWQFLLVVLQKDEVLGCLCLVTSPNIAATTASAARYPTYKDSSFLSSECSSVARTELEWISPQISSAVLPETEICWLTRSSAVYIMSLACRMRSPITIEYFRITQQERPISGLRRRC